MRAWLLPMMGMLLLTACGPTPPSRVDWQHSHITTRHPIKANTLWVAHSHAWQHIVDARYREATRYTEAQAKRLPKGSWAVVLDVDQTVLNNIPYHLAQDTTAQPYSPETWRDWVEERAALPMPGVVDYIARVNQLGGQVVFVTNRRSYEADATIDNLAKIGLRKGRDYVLLITQAWPDGAKEKDDRFRAVDAHLSDHFGMQVRTIAYLGDQSSDKPTYATSAHFFCIPQGNLYGKPCEFEGVK